MDKLQQYFNNNPSKEILLRYRDYLKSLIPEGTEVLSYGIPTIDLNGKHVIHFAGYKSHIGIYPTSSVIEEFKNRLKEYKLSKGTIQIPLNVEIPFKLLKDIVNHRLKQIN